jgi:hypothetical protein
MMFKAKPARKIVRPVLSSSKRCGLSIMGPGSLDDSGSPVRTGRTAPPSLASSVARRRQLHRLRRCNPRYAPDALPRIDCAGRPPAGLGRPPFRLCQEPRPPELAGAPWPTWRRFDPSSSPSAIDLGNPLSNSVDQPQNAQQIETFWVNDRTRDCRRDDNLRLETTFFSKASYFAVLVQF